MKLTITTEADWTDLPLDSGLSIHGYEACVWQIGEGNTHKWGAEVYPPSSSTQLHGKHTTHGSREAAKTWCEATIQLDAQP